MSGGEGEPEGQGQGGGDDGEWGRMLLYKLLTLAMTVAAAAVMADPELPGKLWYKFRIWQAYQERPVNTSRLRHMRALRWAGYYDSDLKADEEQAS